MKPLTLRRGIAGVLLLLTTWLLGGRAASPAQGQELNFIEVIRNVEAVEGLDGASSAAVSPDGAYVYVAGSIDNTVATFSRNATTGKLTFVGFVPDGFDMGLGGVESMMVSPDGAHLYTASHAIDAVAVFSRDAMTGALTQVERQEDGVGGVDGLLEPFSVTMSPDGAHVYAAGSGDNAVAVFSRNAATGALTFVEFEQDGVGGVDGLEEAHAVAVSPDGAHLYAAGTGEDAVAVFSRNAATGALTWVEVQKDGIASVDGLDGVKAVTVSPDGAHVYTAAGSGDNAVAVFSRNAATGQLTFVEVQKDGVDGVDGLAGANAVAVSPDGAHLYATGESDDAVAVFSRDAATGALTFVEMKGGVNLLNGASSVTLSPDGAHLYATARNGDVVVVFSRNATTGALTLVERQEDGLGSIASLDGAHAVATWENLSNAYVYAAASVDDAVTVFRRNVTTGVLTFLEQQKNGVNGVFGLNGARSVTVSPDGQHLYAASSNDDAVAVFSRDGAGRLTFVERQKDGLGGVDGLDGAWSVTVSPDGQHLYAAGSNDDAVAVFSRNAGTGQLTFVEALFDGTAGVDGLETVRSVTISPGGGHVYAAGFSDDAVAVFSRDAMTGALTFVEQQKDGLGGVDGLDGASSVAVSPDGAHVYAAGGIDDAVAVFSRDAMTGALTFVEFVQDGAGGVDGLDGASSVAIHPDGNHVYAASGIDDAVAVFSRDATTGALTFVAFVQDGAGGVDGLDGATSVAVSPNGNHVYTTAQNDDAVAGFTWLGPGFVVRYVATTGSDTNNDCTEAATPCATIAHAVSEADDGDTLAIAAGVYIEPGLVIDKALTIQGQGVVVQ